MKMITLATQDQVKIPILWSRKQTPIEMSLVEQELSTLVEQELSTLVEHLSSLRFFVVFLLFNNF
jgi:hypothetical protein